MPYSLAIDLTLVQDFPSEISSIVKETIDKEKTIHKHAHAKWQFRVSAHPHVQRFIASF